MPAHSRRVVKPRERERATMGATHPGETLSVSNGFEVIDCGICGFKHVNPIPMPDDLKRIYEKEYYASENPDWIEKTLRESDYWRLVYDDRYDVLERFVSAGHLRILDVGSFLGLFLKRGKERGWEVLGIEPSEQGVRYAAGQGILTHKGFFEDLPNESLGHFGAVNLSLTLEHVTDPAAILSKTHELLWPGGIVCVEVPNDFSPLQAAVREALGKPVYWAAPPHHINYFDFDSLTRLLVRCGFSLIHKTTTFPMEMFLLMGEDYLGNDPLGRSCHAKRMAFELNLAAGGMKEFRRELYRFLASWNVGREVVLFAQKPYSQE